MIEESLSRIFKSLLQRRIQRDMKNATMNLAIKELFKKNIVYKNLSITNKGMINKWTKREL